MYSQGLSIRDSMSQKSLVYVVDEKEHRRHESEGASNNKVEVIKI